MDKESVKTYRASNDFVDDNPKRPPIHLMTVGYQPQYLLSEYNTRPVKVSPVQLLSSKDEWMDKKDERTLKPYEVAFASGTIM